VECFRGRRVLAAGLCVAIGVLSAGGCERSAESSRALIAARRASWAREIAGIKEQHAALEARLGGQAAGPGAGPAEQRARAVLAGVRQSIDDVETQLAQAETRMQRAVGESGESGERAIDEESVKARSYLQALSDGIAAAAQQLEQMSNRTP